MSYRISSYNWNRISWIVAIEAGVIVIIASYFRPGGDDLFRYYIPFADGCLDCGFVPYFAQWILWPLTLVPAKLAWPIWTTVSVAGFTGLCKYTKTNPAIVILSFPAMGQFWLGQIDIIVAAGLVLGLLGTNPYLRGVGILLALVKPQLAGLAVLVLLLHQPRRDMLKVLAAPAAALVVSFLVYGLNWPVEWLRNALKNLPAHVWRMASRDVWPYGTVGVLAVPLFRRRRPRFESTLLATALATPFFGVYSYLVLLLFRAPLWCLPLSYLWTVAYPWMGNASMRFAWVLPAALLGYVVWRERSNTEEQVM